MISFQEYIIENYQESDVAEILDTHSSAQNRELLELSRNLLIWSFVGFAIDIIIIGSAGFLTLINGLGLVTIGPSVIFLIVNLIAKYYYVSTFTSKKISSWLTIKAILPYLGSVLIIAYLAKSNPLYASAFKGYLKEFKKSLNWKNITANIKKYYQQK